MAKASSEQKVRVVSENVEFRDRAPKEHEKEPPHDMFELIAHGAKDAGPVVESRGLKMFPRKRDNLRRRSLMKGCHGWETSKRWPVSRIEYSPKKIPAPKKLSPQFDKVFRLGGVLETQTTHRAQFMPHSQEYIASLQWNEPFASREGKLKCNKPLVFDPQSEAREEFVAKRIDPPEPIRPKNKLKMPVESEPVWSTYRETFTPPRKARRSRVRFVLPRKPIYNKQKMLMSDICHSVTRDDFGPPAKTKEGCELCGCFCEVMKGLKRKEYVYVPTSAPLETKTTYRIDFGLRPKAKKTAGKNRGSPAAGELEVKCPNDVTKGCQCCEIGPVHLDVK